jgi:hypothetical protein
MIGKTMKVWDIQVPLGIEKMKMEYDVGLYFEF